MRAKKGGHGGRRPGSGRKPIYGEPIVPYSVRITRGQAELLSMWGGGDVSAGLRWLIAAAQPMVCRREYGAPVQAPPPTDEDS